MTVKKDHPEPQSFNEPWDVPDKEVKDEPKASRGHHKQDEQDKERGWGAHNGVVRSQS